MDIVDAERPVGVITTLGGKRRSTSRALAESGVKIMGTQPDAIDFAEDRERFSALLDRLGIMYPPAGMATSFEEAEAVAAQIGYPLLVRPSYVLGGRSMMITYDAERLREYMAEATHVSRDHPIYLTAFLGAYESDVDALCDGENVYIGASWSISRRRASIPATRPRASRRSPSPSPCRKSCVRRRAALRWRSACVAW